MTAARDERLWQQVGSASAPNWYLDPVVARQKSHVHAAFVRACVGRSPDVRIALKTDLFEEAFGDDVFFPSVFPGAHLVGMDISSTIAAKAHSRFPALAVTVGDARTLALSSGSVDVVVSNSTLDHFATVAELHTALDEVMRIVRPGGCLVLTLDNPENPLYPALRWLSRRGKAPYPLGATLSLEAMATRMQSQGYEVTRIGWLIHNPRIVSTALFLMLRRLFGRGADRPIAAALAAFDLFRKLPTRRYTACFYGVCIRKGD